MSSAAILRQHIEQVWGRCDTDLAFKLYAPGIVDHMPFPGQSPGPAGMVDVLRAIHAGIPDLTVEVHEVIDLGDGRALDRWTMRGTHGGDIMGVAPTGAKLEFSGIDIARIENGLITEIWHVEELLHLALQIGLKLPAA